MLPLWWISPPAGAHDVDELAAASVKDVQTERVTWPAADLKTGTDHTATDVKARTDHAAADLEDSADGAAADTTGLRARLDGLSPFELDEVVWLARCIYSESDRPHEQELVAWVVRNRVETAYRGTTYREVILEDRQFSAFNNPTRRRSHIVALTPRSPSKPWQRALGIALNVYEAGPTNRPFPQTVRHFYSPISMKGRTKPVWADSGEQLSSARLGVDPFRFRFFDDVDEGIADAPESVAEEKRRSGGFLKPVLKPSGRVARPRRPSVHSAQNP